MLLLYVRTYEQIIHISYILSLNRVWSQVYLIFLGNMDMKVENLWGAASLVDPTCIDLEYLLELESFRFTQQRQDAKFKIQLDGFSHLLRINVMYFKRYLDSRCWLITSWIMMTNHYLLYSVCKHTATGVIQLKRKKLFKHKG